MPSSASGWVHSLTAVLLGAEIFLNVPWIGRILAMAVVHDGTVLLMVALRAAVTALQTSAAWMLWQRLPAGPRFGQIAVLCSALLLFFELGLRLSPSSVTPGLRGPLVVGYAVYAVLATWLLRSVGRDR